MIPKFRAWDKRKQKMVGCDSDGYTMQIIQGHPVVTNTFLTAYDDVMQFLGIKDIKGEELYEGDRVSIESITYTIESLKYFYWMQFDDQMGIKFLNADDEPIFEIIGNVYEDKGMLK